jgi:hypothetical protein
LKLGWQKLGSINPAVRIKPRQIFVEKRFKSYARKLPILPGVYTKLQNVLRSHGPAPTRPDHAESSFNRLDQFSRDSVGETSHVFIEDAPRPKPMADMIARLPADRRMQHVRDIEYFAWRYCNPRSIYRFLYWGENELEGYLILQTPARPGIHPVTIVDWEAQNLSVRAELLNTAIRLGDFDRLTIWGVSLPLEIVELLNESGFVFIAELREQDEYQPEILLRPSGIDPGETAWGFGDLSLLDLQNWDFRPIYSDSY